MKTIFDAQTREDLIMRIQSIPAGANAQWGKMDLYQMLKHCTLNEELLQGKKIYKRLFIGKLFGAMALRRILKNEAPMKQNLPTHPNLKITGAGNSEQERNRWIALLQGYATFANDEFMHPFFGRMTKEDIGQLAYKHADHHVRQFGG